MNNSFGNIFRLTTFGESHGKAIGGIIDGCPAGHLIDFDHITYEMQRRKPGQSKIVTQRKEDDSVEFISGIFKGKTTGTPIGFLIKNKDQKSEDYDHLKDSFRPSHADFVYEKNMVSEITGEVVEVLLEKQLVELLLVLSQNNYLTK